MAPLTIGVVGAGTMGRGIAQLAAQAGIAVLLLDTAPGAVEAAREAITADADKLASRGRLSPERAAAVAGLVRPAATLLDLAPCGLVVEAIVEDLAVKQALFQALEGVLTPEAVLATNTSSLSVAALAAVCQRPQRVAGLHFFNPVPLMKLVEIIEGPATSPEVIAFLTALTRQFGHQPVAAKDMPGFIVNHAGRAYGPEALRIVSEGVAEFATVDAIMRDAAGFRMGPFELFDLIGLDVSRRVMQSIYDQFHQEPRFRPVPLVAQRVAAGLLGRKSGKGFVTSPASPAPVAAKPDRPVWVSGAEPEMASPLIAALEKAGVVVEHGSEPSPQAVILLTPLGEDTTSAVLRLGLDPARTLSVDMLFPEARRYTLMPSPATSEPWGASALAALAATGQPVSLIHDGTGFVAQRIVAQIVSIGCEIAQQRIATPADIDLAVRLGLGYPHGPFALGDRIGPRRVLRILQAMHAATGDPCYRPSAWLRRRAMLGLPLAAPD
ncbi:MAG: paaH [Rubritepida sp.]|nr:paaH [Rubritepida sp.]